MDDHIINNLGNVSEEKERLLREFYGCSEEYQEWMNAPMGAYKGQYTIFNRELAEQYAEEIWKECATTDAIADYLMKRFGSLLNKEYTDQINKKEI